ncbi:hypothetical protein, partial [Shigella boydii]|uniref:hypothetical protein n=1 Tax=Shigella boydii TaxID=621 RepID=UPI003AAB2412
FSSGAGRTSDGNGSHASTLKSPSYTKSVSWQHYQARVVRPVGIGAGCFCDPIQYMEYQADYYITINDSIKTWVQTQYSKDSGLPMAVIGHSVAEEAGMRRLASYLDLHSGYPCIHFTGGCDYDWIE